MDSPIQHEAERQTQAMTCSKCSHEFDCPTDLLKRCYDNDWPLPNCPRCRKKRDNWYNLRQALQRLRFLIHPEGVPEDLRAIMRKDPKVSEMPEGVHKWAVTVIRNSEEIVHNAKEYGMFRGFVTPDQVYDHELDNAEEGGETVERNEEESEAATASSS